MKTSPRRARRVLGTLGLAVAGAAVSLAIWVSGSHDLALGALAFYCVASGVTYLWSGGRGDVAAILRAGGDERQRGLDRDATAIAGLVVVLVAVVGAIVAVARTGNPGDFGVICLVSGVTYATSLAVLRHRR
ncbi:MAG: hypothetical protein ACHQFZ_08850 [Acidimicrobiales bacterium]